MTPRELGAQVGRAYAKELEGAAEAAFARAIDTIGTMPDLTEDDETLIEVIVGFTSALTLPGMSAGARASILEYLATARPDLLPVIERKLAALSS